MGIAVVIVSAVAHWSTVRDQVEAWHFQLTTETQTIEPRLLAPLAPHEGAQEIEIDDPEFKARLAQHVESVLLRHGFQAPSMARYLIEDLARCSGFTVIFDPAQTDDPSVSRGEAVIEQLWPEGPQPSLRRHGWRVLEQRFPRRAYVVIRAVESPAEQPHFQTAGGAAGAFLRLPELPSETLGASRRVFGTKRP